jgi:hypothetical protein
MIEDQLINWVYSMMIPILREPCSHQLGNIQLINRNAAIHPIVCHYLFRRVQGFHPLTHPILLGKALGAVINYLLSAVTARVSAPSLVC